MHICTVVMAQRCGTSRRRCGPVTEIARSRRTAQLAAGSRKRQLHALPNDLARRRRRTTRRRHERLPHSRRSPRLRRPLGRLERRMRRRGHVLLPACNHGGRLACGHRTRGHKRLHGRDAATPPSGSVELSADYSIGVRVRRSEPLWVLMCAWGVCVEDIRGCTCACMRA